MSDKSLYESSHIYSKAPEAAAKRKIDEKIMGGDFSKRAMIDMTDEAYLKELIRLASGDKVTVSDKAKGLQFFIVKGGAEGFLGAGYGSIDASRIQSGGGTTSDAKGTIMVFDLNDLIAVFDAKGKLLSSALLIRPLSVVNPDIWTEPTAEAIYNAWDGRSVSLYYNYHFKIKYYGLRVDDSLGWYDSGRVRVDIHKQEATNGCIFIVDKNTPPYYDANKKVNTAMLDPFEPQFIKDVQAAIGGPAKSNIGTMHIVEVK